jgi:L-threonylcarbamoyladenylate synthase
MQVIKLTKGNQNEVLNLAAKALKAGQIVVFPTDTSYALGALVESKKGINRIYKIKQRSFKQPVHIFVPSLGFARKILSWDLTATKLSKAFLPGPLSLALPLKSKSKVLTRLSAKTGYLGIRMANNFFEQALVKKVGAVTATSANPSGAGDPYSAEDIISRFSKLKFKPDIIIDAGRLKKTKPSTFVKIEPEGLRVLRPGPISEKQIIKALKP